MKWKYLIMAAVCGLLLATTDWTVQGDTAVPDVADLWFTAADFASGSGSGYLVTEAGLTVAETAYFAAYISPVLDAPIPFNAAVPQWIADQPPDTHLHISLRTASDGGPWTEWVTIHAQDDWMLPGEPDVVGDMFVIPDTTTTHDQIQFAVNVTRAAGGAPILQQLRITLIDATGPTAVELAAQQQALDAGQTGDPYAPTDYPKPGVISREVWCVPHYGSDCYYSDVDHYTVTHLILHHTVSSNDYTDGAAVVRAIWRFHTYTRGWGDIGYNFLVDLNGNLYEGHLGGDDAVGTHAAEANRGTMALSLVGTFTAGNGSPPGIAPPAAMRAAAADLFAWKADQRNINVFEASDALPEIPWGLPTLMGHRDVFGGSKTECPGEQAYVLLPQLRQDVADRLGQSDPHIYADELSSDFIKSNANWYEGVRGCGHNGHSYYTWSTTDPGQSTNWGEWRPQVPVNGRYEIEIYAPYCDTGAAETDGATYTIQHMHGSSSVTISQNDDVGLWMSLGEFDLTAGTGNVIHLSDLTTTDSGRGVWFDSVRLLPVETAATLNTPADGIWLGNPIVDFAWALPTAASVAQTRLQVATDANFGQIVLDKSWDTAVSEYDHHVFGQEYPTLYWRIITTSTFGTTLTSEANQFGLDLTPPTSAITLIYRHQSSNAYHIHWSGSDTLSGIARYNIEYRAEDETNWRTLLANTTANNAVFIPPDPAQVYWFRSQAVDAVGNMQSPNPDGDMSTMQAIVLTHAIMLPVVSRQ